MRKNLLQESDSYALDDRQLANFKQARKWIADQVHFDMSNWAKVPIKYALENGDYDSEPDMLNAFYVDCERERLAESFIEKGLTVPCGTVACAAGTIAINLGQMGQFNGDSVDDAAANYLGIDEEESQRLFVSSDTYDAYTLQEVTREDVLKIFDNCIESKSTKPIRAGLKNPESLTFDPNSIENWPSL